MKIEVVGPGVGLCLFREVVWSSRVGWIGLIALILIMEWKGLLVVVGDMIAPPWFDRGE